RDEYSSIEVQRSVFLGPHYHSLLSALSVKESYIQCNKGCNKSGFLKSLKLY
ncbi:MAG: hypothetical protein ACI927_000322, partial [Oceanospirillaceae bacterium]